MFGISSTLSLVIMVITLYFPLTFRIYVEIYRFIHCGGQHWDFGWIFFVPVFIASAFVPFAGIVLMIISPFYAFFNAIKAVLYYYNNNDISTACQYSKEFNIRSWVEFINYIFDTSYVSDNLYVNEAGNNPNTGNIFPPFQNNDSSIITL